MQTDKFNFQPSIGVSGDATPNASDLSAANFLLWRLPQRQAQSTVSKCVTRRVYQSPSSLELPYQSLSSLDLPFHQFDCSLSVHKSLSLIPASVSKVHNPNRERNNTSLSSQLTNIDVCTQSTHAQSKNLFGEDWLAFDQNEHLQVHTCTVYKLLSS